MKRPARSPRRRQRGFSLLEMLVAFSIMAMALGVLYRATGGSVAGMGAAALADGAAAVAESLLESRDAIDAAGWNEAGTSGPYRWSVRTALHAGTASADMPQLHTVQIEVQWADGDAVRGLAVSTLRPERLAPLAGRL